MVVVAVPSKDSVMASLASSPEDAKKPGYDSCMYESIARYNAGMTRICKQLAKRLAAYDLVLMHPVK